MAGGREGRKVREEEEEEKEVVVRFGKKLEKRDSEVGKREENYKNRR